MVEALVEGGLTGRSMLHVFQRRAHMCQTESYGARTPVADWGCMPMLRPIHVSSPRYHSAVRAVGRFEPKEESA